jgi:hypothetical protein
MRQPRSRDVVMRSLMPTLEVAACVTASSASCSAPLRQKPLMTVAYVIMFGSKPSRRISANNSAARRLLLHRAQAEMSTL